MKNEPKMSLNQTAHDKYLNDPAFKTLVNALESYIATYQTTPSELRQAVMYACTLHEERTIRPFLVPKTTWHFTDKSQFDKDNQ